MMFKILGVASESKQKWPDPLILSQLVNNKETNLSMSFWNVNFMAIGTFHKNILDFGPNVRNASKPKPTFNK